MTQVALPPVEPVQPSLTVSSLTFSGGASIQLGEHDVVLFVGPNNSGKSAALRQIEASLGLNSGFNVVTACEIRKRGTSEDFERYVRAHAQLVTDYGVSFYVGYKYKFRTKEVASEYGNERSEAVRDFFVLRSTTDDRLVGSNPVKSIAYMREQSSHPIHLLVMDRDVERRVGESFSRAFGEYLYVNRAEGSEVTLYVSDKRPEEVPQDAFTSDSVSFFSTVAKPLHRQGDGMRAFATLGLNSLAISQQTVLLVDEPEVFLHPPQARLLGRDIVSQDVALRQTFIATHSADILAGVLESPNRTVHILRITRVGDVNNISTLDPDFAKQIVADPLVRFSGVFNAIFYKHVIFCESDTDCQFYGSVLDIPTVSGEVRPDVLFVHGSGKHRLVKLAKISKELGVPFSIIVDVDAISEKSLFRGLADVAGVQWDSIEGLWKDVVGAVNAQRARLTLTQLAAAVEESLAKLRNRQLSLSDFMTDVKEAVGTNSPWTMVKRGGRSALPVGDIVEKFDRLLLECANQGLWIVPVGELEGFCRSVGSSKGSAWMAKLLEIHDLAHSPELHDARDFVQRIWEKARQA